MCAESVNGELAVRIGRDLHALTMDPIDRDASDGVLGTRLHLEGQDRVASVDDHVADPDPRIEVAMREVERAEPREIRFDGANFVQRHSPPDAGDQVPDFKVLQHLLERVGLRTPDLPRSGLRELAGQERRAGFHSPRPPAARP